MNEAADLFNRGLNVSGSEKRVGRKVGDSGETLQKESTRERVFAARASVSGKILV
jgi:hypothetical protein